MIAIVASIALGWAVGIVSSFLGVGGGVILVTLLVTVGDFGQHEAQATALAFMFPTAIVGLISVRRRGLGDLRASALLGAAGAVGAVAGAGLALAIPADALRTLFATFIAIIGLSMLLRPGPVEGAGSAHPSKG